MSAIVSGVLNSTIGLLCSKLRDYTAERLNESDLNDEKCRQIIVRELDDIKSKLDGLSRKDLLASLSFFKEGVTRLYSSLEISGESCDGPSTSQAYVEDQSEVEGATAMIPVTQAEHDIVQRVSELSELIGNLKIASQDRYKSAKESLKEAKRLATEAFNNAALSSEDRLMASKLRIASRILECLDDPEAAVRDCFLYLKELHDLPAVQAMFSVWYNSDKGITSRIRARFNKKKRDVNVDSIQMINALLIDLAMKFTNISMGCLNWPTIKIGKVIYHPVLHNNAVLKEIEKNDMQFPWICKFPVDIDCSLYHGCALTGKGEILSTSEDGLKLTRRNGECELFCTIPSENDGDILNEIRCLAVDEHDNVYTVIQIPSCSEIVPTKYKLLTFDANGNVKADRSLDITEETTRRLEMSVTKEGMIVICCDVRKTMYICDSTNVKPDYKFPLPWKNVNPYYIDEFTFTVSNKNEIICTFFKDEIIKCFYMYIITMDGKLKRAVQVPVVNSDYYWRLSVVFNHVNETILVSLDKDYDDSDDNDSDDDNDLSTDIDFRKQDKDYDDSDDNDSDDDNDLSTDIDFRKQDHTIIYSFSNNGELLHQFNILGLYQQLISHPNGPIALVNSYKAVMVQM
ncbi:Hypothetical predicted protein [Paramuricea clavata]|uniref:Uncharacterized protein n=1 Tax=Paramuricea clavata TaxID=317549 RepID=A0A6S7IAL7_PARCT|nr:Hypothetical predicted protein [Paramuricea clavata]